MPVSMQARDGPLIEFATKLFVKRRPSAAMRSIFGVRMKVVSYALIVWYEWSSHIMKRIFIGSFGFSSATPQDVTSGNTAAPAIERPSTFFVLS